MANFAQPVPAVPQTQMVDKNGAPSPVWYDFFLSLWRRTGGASGTISAVLDGITAVVGSTLYRGSQSWVGLGPGTQSQVLKMGTTVPAWSLIDGNSFAAQGDNLIFAGPMDGANANPTFRVLASADLNSVAGAIPGTVLSAPAGTGDVGELFAVTVASGSSIALTSATVADIGSVILTPGDWDVWATIGLIPTGGATISGFNAWLSATSAVDPGSPNNGAYLASSPANAFSVSQVSPIGSAAFAVGTNTNVYLSCDVSYTGGSVGGYGFIGARRRR